MDKKKRGYYGIIAGLFGVISNIFLGVIKIIIGVLSHSVTIMADATNNISDCISSIITIVGFILTNKKPSDKHPYGYQRYEYIANLFISLFVFGMGIIFLRESIVKIIKPEELDLSLVTFLILILSCIIKLIQYLYYKHVANKINSDTLESAAEDSKNDIITTTFILISMILLYFTNWNLDGYFGVLVSIYILYNAVGMVNGAIDLLLGIKPDLEFINKIKNELSSYDKVVGIHDLIFHNYGVDSNFVTVHIELNQDMSFIEAHDIAEHIENDFYSKYNILINVHMDPVVLNNKKLDKLKNDIVEYLKEFDDKLSVHDFRLLSDNTILFDIVEDYGSDYLEEEIIYYLKKKYDKYDFSIKIDRMSF